MIKENAKPIPLDMSMKIPKMKGHTTIILKNEKTGEIERHEDDNYMTNAIAEYFANCGFMNYPDIDRANMVQLLLGGIMAFDEPISENQDDPSIVHVPAGHKMIANGSVGTLNNGEVLEMGSYSSTESGWQADGSYVQTYDFTTSQANGTISCVCLTGQAYGYAGEGNSISGVRHATRVNIKTLNGTLTNYSIPANTTLVFPFNFSLSDSSCYALVVEGANDPNRDIEEQDVHCYLRKYRVPISKLNIKDTLTALTLLSEQEITMDSDFLHNINYATGGYFYNIRMVPFNGNLMMFNYSNNSRQEWGSTFTQWLWTLTPNGNVTKTTIVNTSGDTIPGMRLCIFEANYVFFVTSTWSESQSQFIGIDTTNIYVLNRATGTIGKITNPYGAIRGSLAAWDTGTWDFNMLHSSGDGRVVTDGGYVIDAVDMKTYPTNAVVNYAAHTGRYLVNGLIMQNGMGLYRDQSYIASINNLETPVVKTAEKSMKIIYRITFEEEEE